MRRSIPIYPESSRGDSELSGRAGCSGSGNAASSTCRLRRRRRATLSVAMALEYALLAVDPHGQRLMPVDALEMTSLDEKDLRLSLAETARRPL